MGDCRRFWFARVVSQRVMVTIEKYLGQLTENVPGLKSVVVSDRDGIVIFRSPNETGNPETEQMLTTIFSLTTDQTSKIPDLGRSNSVMTFWDNSILLQANYLPLVITLTAEVDANSGELFEILPPLKEALEPTRRVIERETQEY